MGTKLGAGYFHRGFYAGKDSFWRFSRLLQEVYQGKEPLGRRLTEKLLEYGRLKIPDVPSWEQEETCTVRGETEDREQIARRVRNWMQTGICQRTGRAV